jgi:hypothetical protein
VFSETSAPTRATRYKVPKIPINYTTVKTSHKTVLFEPIYYPPMERLINSDSTVTRRWNPATLRNLDDGGDEFPETSILTTAARYNVPEGFNNS